MELKKFCSIEAGDSLIVVRDAGENNEQLLVMTNDVLKGRKVVDVSNDGECTVIECEGFEVSIPKPFNRNHTYYDRDKCVWVFTGSLPLILFTNDYNLFVYE